MMTQEADESELAELFAELTLFALEAERPEVARIASVAYAGLRAGDNSAGLLSALAAAGEGRRGDAERRYRQLLEADPGFDAARIFLAESLILGGRCVEAVNLLDAAGSSLAVASSVDRPSAVKSLAEPSPAAASYAAHLRQLAESLARPVPSLKGA